MVTAHIKSPLGKTEKEAWSKEKLRSIGQELGTKTDIYVIRYVENGIVEERIVPKSLFGMYDELNLFGSRNEVSYLELPQFCINSISELGDIFEDYIRIEQAYGSQRLGRVPDYPTLISELEVCSQQNIRLYNLILAPLQILVDKQPQTDEEEILRSCFLSVCRFTIDLSESISALIVLMSKLQAKSQGKRYGMFEFRRDNKSLQKCVRARVKSAGVMQHWRDQLLAGVI